MKAVTVDGNDWDRFDPRTGDVDITDLCGSREIIAAY
jgi:hypothetical protein